LNSQQLQRSKKSFRKLNIDSIDNNNNLSDSSSSKSDEDDDDDGAHPYLNSFPAEGGKHAPPKFDYDFKQFDNLDSSFPADLKEIMSYIPKFSPQNVEIDYKLQVFIPEFFPSVGDIDAFLKVVTPQPLKAIDKSQLVGLNRLGLEVLDEPGEQSEEALLQIKLRSIFSKPLAAPTALAKSPKDIDKWIQEIQSLHASRVHDNLMQQPQTQINIDNLMTEWPDDIERRMDTCYPSSSLNCSLSEYVKIICNLFDIPIENAENHYDYIRALNILFNLYIAIRKEK
jgi:intraflagellar transport protein 46